MPEQEFMKLAVEEARLSRDEGDERIHPKVGAVVVKDNQVLAKAHRGELELGDHAEYTALEKKLKDHDLSGATIFTTLEPCNHREGKKVSCAERIIERRIERVVIGTLDPNQKIRGRGEWLLADHNIKIGRFDPEFMRSLMDLNRAFIRDQESLGLKITSHPQTAIVTEPEIIVRGTYQNKPAQDEICVFLRRDFMYWPQSRLIIKDDGTWECKVSMKNIGTNHVVVAKVSEDIALMVELYYEVGRKHNDWLGRKLHRLPKGIQVLNEIEVIRQ